MLLIQLGIIFCALSVIIGAFGAHSLESTIADKMDIFKTGVQYQIFHSLALILTGILFGPILFYFHFNGIPLPIDYSDMGLIISKTLMPVYSPILLIATALIVFIILLIVSYIPSRKISKMHPVDAIRGKTTL